MSALRLAARPFNLSFFRQISKTVSAQTATEAVSSSSEQPFPIPTPDGVDKTYSPKITKLANDISSLTLLECADLSSLLKKQLNLPDAPMMAMGAFAQAPIAAAPVEEEEEKIVQSLFTVKLVKYDDKQKVPLIKEIKGLLEGMNLVQAKKFVESIPAVVKTDVTKEEAEALKASLAKVGGEVSVE
ncbi:hypothetical protein M8J76_017050 [Diaphorina citri]|nr:hypothetical protein M8J76_017050 [Diaphorina citri]KAI5729001.1 hypothetical protein M8J77_024057 [Diaphorina citri]